MTTNAAPPSAPAQDAQPQGTNAAPAPPSGQQQAPKGAPAKAATPSKQPAGVTEAQRVNGTAPTKTEGGTSEQQAQDAVKAAAKKYKLQLNGSEIEATAEEIIEQLGEGRTINAAQIERAARARMRQAAEKEKLLEQAANDLRDPERAFALYERIHGTDAAMKAFERRYAKWMQEQAQPEEIRQQRRRESELERRERELNEREAKYKQQDQAQRRVADVKSLGAKFEKAASSAGLDGKDPNVIARMAALIEGSLHDEPYTPEEAAAIIADEGKSSLQKALRSMAPEALAAILGEDGVKKWRAWDVARLKARRENGQFSPPSPAPQKREPSSQPAEKPRQSINDLFRDIKAGKR